MTEDLFRFYEDLGIIANRGTAMENNDNLLQGNNEINLDATTFQPINNSSKTIEGRKINSVLETRSIKYHYIAWAIFAIFIIWAIFNISTFSFSGINFSSEFQPAQNESNMFSMVIIIILIIIVFVVFRQFNSSQVKTTVRVYDNSKKDNGNGNGNGNGDSKSKNDIKK
jgi:hypothetical protein